MLNLWLANIGGFALGICALPQALKVIQTKSAKDISWIFLFLWGFGDLSLLAFGIRTHLPFMIVWNNIVNAICIAIIIWFK